jgi:hypothetical protein
MQIEETLLTSETTTAVCAGVEPELEPPREAPGDLVGDAVFPVDEQPGR